MMLTLSHSLSLPMHGWFLLSRTPWRGNPNKYSFPIALLLLRSTICNFLFFSLNFSFFVVLIPAFQGNLPLCDFGEIKRTRAVQIAAIFLEWVNKWTSGSSALCGAIEVVRFMSWDAMCRLEAYTKLKQATWDELQPPFFATLASFARRPKQ